MVQDPGALQLGGPRGDAAAARRRGGRAAAADFFRAIFLVKVYPPEVEPEKWVGQKEFFL